MFGDLVGRERSFGQQVEEAQLDARVEDLRVDEARHQVEERTAALERQRAGEGKARRPALESLGRDEGVPAVSPSLPEWCVADGTRVWHRH